MVRQGVQLVVPHDGQGVTALDHGADNLKHLSNLWPPVNEVAEKDHSAIRVLVNAFDLSVAQGIQKFDQFVGVAVNVTNQVVHECP
jgi:hypothetical protein